MHIDLENDQCEYLVDADSLSWGSAIYHFKFPSTMFNRVSVTNNHLPLKLEPIFKARL